MADNVRNFTVNSLQQFYNKLNTEILPSYAAMSYVQSAYSYIINEIVDNEYVIAQTFNSHNDRLTTLETAGYITSETQPDWNVTDTSSPAYIKNKPAITVEVDNVIDETSYNAASSYAVAKALNDTEYAVGMALNDLNSKIANAENSMDDLYNDLENNFVRNYTLDERLQNAGYLTSETQPDWNVTSTTSAAYIKNKPTIPSTVTESTVSGWGFTKNTGTLTSETDPTVPSYVKSITQANIDAWNSYANVQVDWNEYDSSKAAYILNKPPTYWAHEVNGGLYSTWGGPAGASGNGSLAVGSRALAGGECSLAIGNFVNAFGDNSQAFGINTTAYAPVSHVEGNYVHAFGIGSHGEGLYTTTGGQTSHTEGGSKYSYYLDTSSSTLEGITTYWLSLDEPDNKFNFAGGDYSHAEGFNTLTSGFASHAEGGSTYASAAYTHAEGWSTFAVGERSHSEGTQTVASGNYSHAEGSGTTASGESSHAEGGWYNVAGGFCSHSEGSVSKAYGNYTHAEGTNTVAYAQASHAEGGSSYTIGNYSHGEGYYTYTYNAAEHAEGQYNQSHKANTTFGNAGNTIHSIGIGTAANSRKNALEIMQNGNAYFLNVGNYNGTNLTSAKPLHTVLNEKQDTISDLATIRSNASAGAAKVSNVQADWNTSSSSDQSYIKNKPTIPTAVTESTVSGWGFTKNAAANNATITIQKGGTNVDSFTVNASSNKSINIPNELPSYSSSDEGKVLSVNSSGQLVWITPVSIYTGSGEPNNANGNDGDIYLQS